jgi:hypothetical protein
MACLNLPLDIRYKPENMYLAGIIPQPTEPDKTELNHYERPIINDMVDAWEKGIHFTRTPREPNGRDTRSAIAIVVNDLPAARKAAGLASYRCHFYCSVCTCTGLETRGCTNFDDWKVRDRSEIRRHAEAWRDATTSVERDKIFKAHAVRWSEFWRLPYWNPTTQLVVDCMHCILEGLGEHHARDVLRLTMAEATAKPKEVPPYSHNFLSEAVAKAQMPEHKAKHVPQIHALLLAPVKGSDPTDVEESLQKLTVKLMTKNATALKFVVDDLGLTVEPNKMKLVRNADGSSYEMPIFAKKELITVLIAWVSTMSQLFKLRPLSQAFSDKQSLWTLKKITD